MTVTFDEIMKASFKILLLSAAVIFFSCDKQILFIDDNQIFTINCTECTSEEPVFANLEINLERAYEGGILINVYEGNLEDSVLYIKFTGTGASVTPRVILNKQYTVTATYIISGKKYIVVDSAMPRVKYDKKHCNDPCYFVYDNILDLRLKNSIG